MTQISQNILHPIHFSVVRLHTYARDNALEVATGFFITGEREGEIRHALVTNWHVLAGRNPLQPTLTRHRSGAVPDSVRFTVHRLESEPGIVTIEEVTVDLYDSAGHATWSQHPSRGRLVDVGILEFGAEHVAGFNVQGVNAIASANDMAVRLGSQAFIVGYPHGFGGFVNTPIWKRGSIASEPHVGEEGANDRVLVDATTREGMSGSPVLLCADTHYLTEGGQVMQAPGAMRWIGLYSSRPSFEVMGDTGPAQVTAEIAYFIKTGPIVETLMNRTLAADRGVVPD